MTGADAGEPLPISLPISLPSHALERLLTDAEPLLAEIATPQRIGKYRLGRMLGRGGMGVVYEAFDEELKRSVALKLLDAAAATNDALRERLLREARAAARLHHPNIVAIYAAGDGWIAMQLISGTPLHQAPPADLKTRVSWIRDAALAVQHAHEAGIVHRDLKPHNLLLENGHVFVTDFGLAKELEVNSSLSLSGHILGSPGYMAPEQAQGRVHAVDARTDVFGLGATLYHLLAGRPPFVGNDVVALLAQIVDGEPPWFALLAPLVATSLAPSLAPSNPTALEVPRDLETIVRKCLEKEPSRRYASARALADDLDRFLRDEPVLARRRSPAERAAKFARRHRALVGLSAASLFTLAVVGAFAWKQRVGRKASTRALGLGEEVAAVMADYNAHQRLGESEQARARLEQGVQSCRAFIVEHDIAQAHALLGKLERRCGRHEEARRELDQALKMDPDLTSARFERGLLLAQEFARTLAREGIAPNADASAKDFATLAPALVALRAGALADLNAVERDSSSLGAVDAAQANAELKRLRGDWAGARRAFEEMARLDPVSVDAAVARSQLDLRNGDDDAAWHRAMSAVDFYQGLGPAYIARPGVLDAAELLATSRLKLGDVEGALADFTRALQIDPNDAFAWGNRALVRSRLAARETTEGQLEEALSTWDAAIGDATNALTLEPTLVGAWNNRAVSHAEKERLLTALHRSEEAVRERTLVGADLDEALRLNPRFALARLNRAAHRRRVAESAAQRRDWDAAMQELESADIDVETALMLRAQDSDAYLERALAHDLRAEISEARGAAEVAEQERALAVADYDLALAFAPDNARALGLRGLHRARVQDVLGARADLEAALRGPLDGEEKRQFAAEIERLLRGGDAELSAH